MSSEDRLQTLLHEAAHAICHARWGADEGHSPRFWAVKASAPAVFHGRPVPLLELLAAALAAAAVAFVLREPLAPHRDAVWGA